MSAALTANHLETVARVYLDALEAGHPPVRAVATVFAAPPPTVSKWVRRAKDAGLIPDQSYVRANVRHNRKLVAVANAVGVTPHALRCAVLVHAGGDLRVKP